MWVIFLILLLPLSVHAEDLGELSANPFNPASTSNPFSNQSATNPYATDAPRLFARLSGLSGLSGLFGLSGSFG